MEPGSAMFLETTTIQIKFVSISITGCLNVSCGRESFVFLKASWYSYFDRYNRNMRAISMSELRVPIYFHVAESAIEPDKGDISLKSITTETVRINSSGLKSRKFPISRTNFRPSCTIHLFRGAYQIGTLVACPANLGSRL